MVAWTNFSFAGLGPMLAWTLFHGCLQKICGCQDSLPGSLAKVVAACIDSWLPGLFHACLVKVSGCLDSFPFLVVWTWSHACLVKVPGCLDLLLGCLVLVPWLPGEGS